MRVGLHASFTRALDDDEPLAREHAAWALDVLDARDGSA
jgi:hypothetical protein